MQPDEMAALCARILEELGLEPNGLPRFAHSTWRVPYRKDGIATNVFFPDPPTREAAERAIRSHIFHAHKADPVPLTPPQRNVPSGENSSSTH